MCTLLRGMEFKRFKTCPKVSRPCSQLAQVMSNDNRMYVMGGTADTPPAFDFNFFDATAGSAGFRPGGFPRGS